MPAFKASQHNICVGWSSARHLFVPSNSLPRLHLLLLLPLPFAHHRKFIFYSSLFTPFPLYLPFPSSPIACCFLCSLSLSLSLYSSSIPSCRRCAHRQHSRRRRQR